MKESYSLPCNASQIYLPFKIACKDLRLTYVELADGSGVSLHIIQKFMSGSAKKPNLDDLVSMAKFLNNYAEKTVISLDELCGISEPHPCDEDCLAIIHDLRNDNAMLKAAVAHKDELLKAENNSKEYHRKAAKNLRIALIVILTALFCLLIADCLNGGWGYVRYAMEHYSGDAFGAYLARAVSDIQALFTF